MGNWSDLSKDLLHSIGERLETHFDVLHFRSVCSAWRSAVPLNLRPLPTLYFVFHGEPQTHCIGTEVKNCALIRGAICLFNSQFPADHGRKTWLGWITESEGGRKQIYRPIEIDTLPPMVLDISKLHVQVLGFEYSSQMCFGGATPATFSEGGVCAMNVSPNHDDEFYVLKSHYSFSTSVTCLRLFKTRLFKTGEEEFIRIGMEGLNDRTHFIPFKRNFYVVDNLGTTFSIDPSSGAKSLVTKAFTFRGGRNYLVESLCGKLFLIEWIEECSYLPPPRVGLKVYQLDEEKKIWIHLESLGDMILFFNTTGCKFSARGIPGVEGNCVVFSANLDGYVFDLRTKKTVPLASRPDLLQLFPPGSMSLMSTKKRSTKKRVPLTRRRALP